LNRQSIKSSLEYHLSGWHYYSIKRAGQEKQMVDQSQFLEAARTGPIETIREYLDQPEADIECRGYLNQTALLLATWNGRTEVARLLIKSGADVHNAWYPAQQAVTALEMAAENGHEDLVALLLEAGGVRVPLPGR
jgi:ankyrin repeat protein